MIGQTLSHYRITDALGAGGMGEVYRATDVLLGREVAIKVLPPEMAGDPERLARFRREAHLLASLNHPNIAAIYGLEEADGRPFLALELVEGEDLRKRLSRGALPVAEALEIARQIAEALEEAHGKGIVHRDLKPANVKLTPDGKAKVLDFGLAKAWGTDADPGWYSADLSSSPTLARARTVAGVILGTAGYMSPEQAAGKAVDKRADVWSFGVVLFEMLAGRAPFDGETTSEVMASVIKEDPAWGRLPKECPRAIDKLLRRCLRKRPRERLQDIGDVRLEIQEVQAGAAGEAGATPEDLEAWARNERSRRVRERWVWTALLVAGLLAGRWAVRRPEAEPRPAARFVMEAPTDVSLVESDGPAVSPDGRSVAFTAATAGASVRPRIWVRRLESLGSHELPGTDGAYLPFWSPDSQSIAFFVDGELRAIDLSDGAVRKICSTPAGSPGGGDWSAEDTVVFSAGGPSARLFTVSSKGSEPKVLTTLDEAQGETAHYWPQFLPDGRRLLFEVLAREGRSGVYLASLEAPQARKRVLPVPNRAEYGEGRLVFVRDGTLLAQRFDSARGELLGDPSTVAAAVAVSPDMPWGWFSVSPAGVLAFGQGQGSARFALAWFDRQGARLGTTGDAGDYRQIALSPDERYVAVELGSGPGGGSQIWTMDVERGIGTRQTFEGQIHVDPVWSLDGNELIFSSLRDGAFRIYRKSLWGNQRERPAGTITQSAFPESFTPDGKTLVFGRQDEGGQGFGTLPWPDGGEPQSLLAQSHQLDEPQVSPDGRWLAYVSDESARFEVYVEPFRRSGERIRVSPAGGGQPKWRGDGRELFYVAPDGRLMSAGVKSAAERFEVTLPVPLFGGLNPDPVRDKYAATRDGRRFLAIVPSGNADARRIQLVTNWPSLLR